MELHENLARLRKEKGLSQLELAEELNVTRQAVSRWETGAAVPMVDTLVQLSKLYGVSLDDLLLHDARLPEKAAEPVPEVPPVREEVTVRKTARRKLIWLCIIAGIAAVCAGILIWGRLTRSMEMAVMGIWGITALALVSLIVYTLIRVLRYISRRERELDEKNTRNM